MLARGRCRARSTHPSVVSVRVCCACWCDHLLVAAAVSPADSRLCVSNTVLAQVNARPKPTTQRRSLSLSCSRTQISGVFLLFNFTDANTSTNFMVFTTQEQPVNKRVVLLVNNTEAFMMDTATERSTATLVKVAAGADTIPPWQAAPAARHAPHMTPPHTHARARARVYATRLAVLNAIERVCGAGRGQQSQCARDV